MTTEPTLLLAGGTLIDGNGATPVPSTDVLLRGDEIIAVGPSGTLLTDPPNDDHPPNEHDHGPGLVSGGAITTIDCTGRTVMPGLIDAHCHITFGEPQSNDELFFHRPQSQAAYLAAFNVPKLLRAGVTGFLDADCIFDLGPALRDAINSGMVEGPRMKSGMNALLTAAGGTAGRLIPDAGRLGYAHVMGDRDEMVRTTRQQIKYGADWVKIHVTGSVPNHKGELSVWGADELRAVVETAHALDTPCVAHCRSADSTALAAECGVDLILHASFMDDRALDAVVASGAAIAPTFTFLANLADHGHAVGAAAGQVDIFRGEIRATAEMMRKAFDAGVTLLCGSESGFSLTPYGEWHAREMEVFVDELGLTPIEAITCATANGALALRMPGEVGVIAPGRRADVLVVDGNPGSDVRVLADRRNLVEVISRGARVDLSRPWPTRSPLVGEKVGMWSAQPLTWATAHPAPLRP